MRGPSLSAQLGMTLLGTVHAQGNPLPFRFWRRLAGFHGKRLGTFKLLLKPTHEVMSAVLEEYDEAEGEKHEEDEPKKAAKQRHGIDSNLLACQVNEAEQAPNFRLNARTKLPSFPSHARTPARSKRTVPRAR